MCKIWKWWNDVKCRHRTCTETIPLFRISEENESSHPRIQSCSKRFKKLFKRLALSSSETYTVNLVNLNTMDAFLDTTCWHVLDTVACATSQHDTITVNSNYGKKKESESLGMELDDNFFDSWKTSRASSCKPGFFFEDFHQQFRFRCLHPFGLGLALVTRGYTKTIRPLKNASIIFHNLPWFQTMQKTCHHEGKEQCEWAGGLVMMTGLFSDLSFAFASLPRVNRLSAFLRPPGLL